MIAMLLHEHGPEVSGNTCPNENEMNSVSWAVRILDVVTLRQSFGPCWLVHFLLFVGKELKWGGKEGGKGKEGEREGGRGIY